MLDTLLDVSRKTFVRIAIGLLCSVFLLACGQEQINLDSSVATTAQKTYKWKMVTSWPKNFPGLGRAPETFAKYVEQMSAGRLTVKVYGAGELVPGFEVFDAVSQGTVQIGHSGAYYWKGKAAASQIFTTIPFGMNAQETNAWLHYGGGLELWREVYQPFGLIPFPGGNTSIQMAGWFKKEINSIDDIQGLKMRIPGLGGEVFKKLGGIPVALTGGELFTSLQSGAIDATEWVGPYNDLSFGLYKAADYYYYSGWHEPGSTLEFIVNQKAFESLPKDLQAIVEVATRAVNQDVLDEYTARNNTAMQTLIHTHNVDMRPLPDDVMRALKAASAEVMQEQSNADPLFKKVYESYADFQTKVSQYHQVSEVEYYKNRSAQD
ncbi:TRAP transporter substrate-binding protein DctP [Paraglaciecola aquimarina]|uniref:TRAP transporter substrate-binding protein DctP n=1 Tax=Paraglaciecola aquimarina TaxID=1235557 RepID=A0ABU3SUA3_9ALTE|nr:TRAP transporter substrate-binding protein DctP [Paraglaciecola aquimarina]MDU0353589.1 TRAP transporter substrate-binding protein DctP [Paraglaciecola aquimarina]